ncbi:hypothetical protein ANCDUO_24686, partial [Ancylostoma duodenale]
MHTGPESIGKFEETIDELKTAIIDVRDDTEVDSLNNLLHSMPKSLLEVACKEGEPIDSGDNPLGMMKAMNATKHDESLIKINEKLNQCWR